MSFPFNAKLTRASNGTVELTPDNQFDLGKLKVGDAVTVGEYAAPKAAKKSGGARKSVVPTRKVPATKKATKKVAPPKSA